MRFTQLVLCSGLVLATAIPGLAVVHARRGPTSHHRLFHTRSHSKHSKASVRSVGQRSIDDGRAVQMGGEVVGAAHHAYLELVAELGLTIEPSYVAEPGEMSWGLDEGAFVGDALPWMTEAERADLERVEARFAQLAVGGPDASLPARQ